MRNVDHKPPLLAEPAILIALTCLAATLLGWPLLQIAGDRGTAVLFVYVFVVWGGLIVLLVGVSRHLRRAGSAARGGETQPAAEPGNPGGRAR